MTTHELARKLLEGPDLLVTRRGYEGGVTEITIVAPECLMHLNVHSPRSYCGPHEYHTADGCVVCYDDDVVLPVIRAIHID